MHDVLCLSDNAPAISITRVHNCTEHGRTAGHTALRMHAFKRVIVYRL